MFRITVYFLILIYSLSQDLSLRFICSHSTDGAGKSHFKLESARTEKIARSCLLQNL